MIKFIFTGSWNKFYIKKLQISLQERTLWLSHFLRCLLWALPTIISQHLFTLTIWTSRSVSPSWPAPRDAPSLNGFTRNQARTQPSQPRQVRSNITAVQRSYLTGFSNCKIILRIPLCDDICHLYKSWYVDCHVLFTRQFFLSLLFNMIEGKVIRIYVSRNNLSRCCLCHSMGPLDNFQILEIITFLNLLIKTLSYTFSHRFGKGR